MARIVVLGSLFAMVAGGGFCAPILDYVNAPDSSFSWSVESIQEQANGATLVKLKMVSQTWQGIPWHHSVWLLVPNNLEKANVATLIITGGEPGMSELMLGAQLVSESDTVFAVLGGIPNQPLYDGRVEDALIAYTFVKYLETKDPTWPLLFPMTKSAVRAMDAIEAFLAQEYGHRLDGFITTGASKRGWTTWFTGVVDPRVVGIAPIVYDNLNLPAQMAQQREVYGGYSEKIDDYTEYNLQDRLATPEGRKLGAIVDPYTYRDRLAMPKLILVGANDPYWTIESAQLYIHDLPGENSILYFPNGGHDLGGLEPALTRLKPAMLAFIEHVAGRGAWPQLSWSWSSVGGRVNMALRSTMKPTDWGIWVATSEDHDFRDGVWTLHGTQETSPLVLGAADGTTRPQGSGTRLLLAPMGKDAWRVGASVPMPDAPYVAVIGEVRFEIDGRIVTLTSPAKIVKRPR